MLWFVFWVAQRLVQGDLVEMCEGDTQGMLQLVTSDTSTSFGPPAPESTTHGPKTSQAASQPSSSPKPSKSETSGTSDTSDHNPTTSRGSHGYHHLPMGAPLAVRWSRCLLHSRCTGEVPAVGGGVGRTDCGSPGVAGCSNAQLDILQGIWGCCVHYGGTRLAGLEGRRWQHLLWRATRIGRDAGETSLASVQLRGALCDGGPSGPFSNPKREIHRPKHLWKCNRLVRNCTGWLECGCCRGFWWVIWLLAETGWRQSSCFCGAQFWDLLPSQHLLSFRPPGHQHPWCQACACASVGLSTYGSVPYGWRTYARCSALHCADERVDERVFDQLGQLGHSCNCTAWECCPTALIFQAGLDNAFGQDELKMLKSQIKSNKSKRFRKCVKSNSRPMSLTQGACFSWNLRLSTLETNTHVWLLVIQCGTLCSSIPLGQHSALWAQDASE